MVKERSAILKYVSLEPSRRIFLKVQFCSGLSYEAETGLVAPPFCRALELAAHCRLAELPFVVLSLRSLISTLGSGQSVSCLQRLFRMTCSDEAASSLFYCRRGNCRGPPSRRSLRPRTCFNVSPTQYSVSPESSAQYRTPGLALRLVNAWPSSTVLRVSSWRSGSG
jgi:hypothetical protein